MACKTFDNLPYLETKVSKDIKISLLNVTGYVTRKDCPTEEEIFNNTSFYFQGYGIFFNKTDCSISKISLDITVQWVFFYFIMFDVVELKTYRNSLCQFLVCIISI